jgi:hypothetical protein
MNNSQQIQSNMKYLGAYCNDYWCSKLKVLEKKMNTNHNLSTWKLSKLNLYCNKVIIKSWNTFMFWGP